MGKIKILIALLICVMCFGCSHKRKPAADEYAQYSSYRQQYTPSDSWEGSAGDWDWDDPKADAPSLRNPKSTSNVLNRAHRAIGTPYVFGGVSPGGFDCSGLVQWAFRGAGIRLPRTAAEQSTVGYRIRSLDKMRAGDIVAFRRRNGGYHTGIYIGNGKFIHAPRTNSRVRIESLTEGYFSRTFIGARRVDMRNGNAAVAAAARAQDQADGGRSGYGSRKKGKNDRDSGKASSRSRRQERQDRYVAENDRRSSRNDRSSARSDRKRDSDRDRSAKRDDRRNSRKNDRSAKQERSNREKRNSARSERQMSRRDKDTSRDSAGKRGTASTQNRQKKEQTARGSSSASTGRRSQKEDLKHIAVRPTGKPRNADKKNQGKSKDKNR